VVQSSHNFKQPRYSLRRYYLDTYMIDQISEIDQHARILDLGGHKSQKRGRFDIGKTHTNVVNLNISDAKMPDILGAGEHLPFASEVFDVVICSEVLEHVPDPQAILRESVRVLKSGGQILITVPFLYRIHADPYDFGRYTESFWQLVLEQVGFSDVEITKHGLYFSVMADNLRMGLEYRSYNSYMSKLFRLMHRFVMPRVFQHAVWRDELPKTQQNQFYSSYTTGYGIHAVKQ